jgi:Ca2+/Na+ antiporter
MPESPVLQLAGTAVAWYAAVHMAAFGLGRDRPAALAVAYALPAAALAMAAVFAGLPNLALGAATATAVAALSLGLGIVVLTGGPAPATATGRRWWISLLPVSALLVVTGLASRFTPIHLAVLVVQGVATLLLVAARRGGEADAFPVAEPVEFPAARPAARPVAWMVPVAVVLVGAGAWLAIRAVGVGEARTGLPMGGVLSALVFAPAITLPMIAMATTQARHRPMGECLAPVVGAALVVLLVVVPLIAVAWPARSFVLASQERAAQVAAATTAPTTAAARALLDADPVDPPWAKSHQLPFAMRLWRVDSVALLILSILLLPVSVGRWTLTRIEGMALVGLYVAYLIATVQAEVLV